MKYMLSKQGQSCCQTGGCLIPNILNYILLPPIMILYPSQCHPWQSLDYMQTSERELLITVSRNIWLSTRYWCFTSVSGGILAGPPQVTTRHTTSAGSLEGRPATAHVRTSHSSTTNWPQGLDTTLGVDTTLYGHHAVWGHYTSHYTVCWHSTECGHYALCFVWTLHWLDTTLCGQYVWYRHYTLCKYYAACRTACGHIVWTLHCELTLHESADPVLTLYRHYTGCWLCILTLCCMWSVLCTLHYLV